GGTWMRQAKLLASDGTAGDLFGSSVAVSGDTAVVGADQKLNYTGGAYVFVRSGTTWTEQQKWVGTAPGDQLGIAVALGGDTAVIGAWGEKSATGAAHVYLRSGSTWAPQGTLVAMDAVPGDGFGFAVALSGDTAVVGAPLNNKTGAAYLFVRSGGGWSQA